MQQIGHLLRKNRIALGLELGDIAKKTCICSRYLKAMEEGKFTQIPNVFDRGYLKIYAKFLNMDAVQLLALFDEMKRKPISH